MMAENIRPTSGEHLLSPPPKFFQAPLLTAIGRLIDFKLGVFVSAERAIPEIIRAAGFDPDKLPDGMSREGRAPAGMDRNIIYCYRYFHRDYAVPRTVKGQPGMWSLTQAGIEDALSLVEKDRPKNLTVEWLTKHLTPNQGETESTLMTMLRAYVAKKLPVSASMDRVDDHIQECFRRLIQRRALDKHLLAGKKITYTHICTYAVNSGFTDVRNDGTEPVARAIYGARTEYERKNKRVLDPRGPAQEIRLVPVESDDGIEHQAVSEYMVDRDLALRQAFEKVWSRLVTVMHEIKPNAAGRYLKVLEMWIHGASNAEIGVAFGVSENRAASMVQESKIAIKALREVLTSDGSAEGLRAAL